MNEQFYHLPITTMSPAAARAIHGFADELLSHGSNARVIFDALASDDECPLGHIYSAALFLTQMTREGQVQAAPRIAAAQELIWLCSPREAATVNAIAAWGAGDERRAVVILRSIVEQWPHDLVAAKLCQILEISVGDTKGMLRTSAMAAAAQGRSSYALGLHGYALEQAGDAELALRYSRRANELRSGHDPWAQHTVAHSLIAMDQMVEARAFLHAHAPDWDRCSSFMLTHNWWHLALCDIELKNPKGALDLFDQRVWGIRKGHCQDQINAISLLARLEMEGVAVGWRWDDIAAYVEPHIEDRISDFLDLHYLYALARSGRDAASDGLVDMMGGPGVSASLANGVLAHARANYQKATDAIAPVVRHLAEIGGSNIQRELFQRIFDDSVMRVRREEAFRVAA